MLHLIKSLVNFFKSGGYIDRREPARWSGFWRCWSDLGKRGRELRAQAGALHHHRLDISAI